MSAVAAHRAPAESIVEGEFAFTFEDFRQIAEALHSDAGIALPDTKATLVYSRLAKRLRALGLSSFRDYCALIESDRGGDERKRMLASLTTNVTRFFREPHHFDHLRDRVLPGLLKRAAAGGRVRIWSAGCSTGQEPYSIALTLLSLMPEAARHDVRILATDIDPNVVAEARRGAYSEDHVSPIPADFRKKWFVAGADGHWQVKPELASLITFNELNLIGRWPMKGAFDAIFCRNVVIYFAESTQAEIWKRFKSIMAPGGTLYIGHSERLTAVESSFESDGLTTYRLLGGAAR
jgi:chemotaxis protein methyltransferase CheR